MLERINAPGVARLPTFCHATRGAGLIFVSGSLGTDGEALELVAGGVGPETRQVLHNIWLILQACGADRSHLLKTNVYLADMADFQAMNTAYLDVMDTAELPARITVGRAGLALDARVEMDAVAVDPRSSP